MNKMGRKQRSGFQCLAGTLALVAGSTLLFVPAPVQATGSNNPELIATQPQDYGSIDESQISSDGRYVAYVDQNSVTGISAIEVYDRNQGSLKIVLSLTSPYDIGTFALSADGSHVAFTTDAPLVPAANGAGAQVYEVSVAAPGAPQLVSVEPDGTAHAAGTPGLQAPSYAVSSDGSSVVWDDISATSEFFSICVTQMASDTSICPIANAKQLIPSFGTGRYVFYLDSNGGSLKYDLLANASQPAYINENFPYTAVQGPFPPLVSPDGQYSATFAFDSSHRITSFSKINVDTGEAVSYPVNPTGPGAQAWASTVSPENPGNFTFSADDNTLLFTGQLTDVIQLQTSQPATEIFAYSFTTGNIEPVSINSWGNYANYSVSASTFNVISADGSVATFAGADSNLGDSTFEPAVYVNGTDGSTNGSVDITPPQVTSVTVSPATKNADGTATVTATAADDFSGIRGGEFFVGYNSIGPAATTFKSSQLSPNSPAASSKTVIGYEGQVFYGAGTPMTLNPDGTLTGTIGTDVPAGSYTVYVRVQDAAGNWSTDSGAPLSVSSDTPPAIGTPTWSVNPVPVGTSTTLTVPANSTTSAIADGEYFVGTDPGAGAGTPMAYDGAELTASLGASLGVGVYNIGIRAQDAAGTWSPVASTMLVVYDTATSLSLTGRNKKNLFPSLAAGDIMPGLVSATQTNAADYGMTVQYKKGSLDPSNDFHFAYITGTSCGTAKASNCHSFSLDATSFSWLVVNGTNNSNGEFQGVATVTVDGTTATEPFTVSVTDGDNLTPSASDYLILKVYPPSANLSTDSPLYQASGSMAKGNSIVIK
jgi:hypothetical protein